MAKYVSHNPAAYYTRHFNKEYRRVWLMCVHTLFPADLDYMDQKWEECWWSTKDMYKLFWV